MNKFTYEVYYEYTGPTNTPSIREKKSPEEIADALSAFPSDLRHFLNDPEVLVDQDIAGQTPTSIFVAVTTNLSEQQIDDGIKQCMKSFDLFGKKIRQ